ncbi:DUF7260 family protein [Halobaculum sp. P14]|uniref:DUF7260 family protein n=1 Tax=Halobaculum sp. P14 TaxID=3421638 RepID=UPI003EBED924
MVAVALAPTTEASFTPELKEMVLAEAQSRRAEATALQDALEREETHLKEAAAAVDDIIAWIVNANETPLTDFGFDALQQRHEILASHRASCEDVARDRQEFLKETTNDGVDAGVRHQSLMPYLYQDFRSTIRCSQRSRRSMKRVKKANEPCETTWSGGHDRWLTGRVDNGKRRVRGCISRSSEPIANRPTPRRSQLIRPGSQLKSRQAVLRRDERGRPILAGRVY